MKDMTQRAIAPSAENFVSFEPNTPILDIINIFLVDWVGKIGPAIAGIELILKPEEREAALSAEEHTRSILGQVITRIALLGFFHRLPVAGHRAE